MERNSVDTATPKNTIPVRSRQAMEDLIDLNDFYTSSLDDDWLGKQGDNLSHYPKGVQAYSRAAFDIRGMVQLAGSDIPGGKVVFPKTVKGIKADVKGNKIHFLMGSRGKTNPDTVIGKFVFYFDNNENREFPMVYGRNVADLYVGDNESILPDADVWPAENSAGQQTKIYKQTINNPFPDVIIKTIDLVSEMTEAAPFIVAITSDKGSYGNDQHYEWFDSPKIWNAIPPRDPKATRKQVDLSDYYHTSLDDDWYNHPGHDLHDLPKGLQLLDGIIFDIRGVITTACSRSLNVSGLVSPEEVKGIKVNCKGDTIYFLHFAAMCPIAAWVNDDMSVGEYVIHYANGEERRIPLEYQKNTLDWWVFPEEGHPSDPNAVEVWYGSCEATRRVGKITRLIKYRWENPLPDVEVETIDLISSVSNAAPLLIAITLE